jgi:hypothetical protein
VAGQQGAMHAATRRPATSWPSALLPGFLLLALMTAGATTATSGGSALGAEADRPVTELHVTGAGR